ncbi:hypothetical protein [Clostridium sp. C8-1-8]|uniref:ATP-binding protein n=1 Tax=Clostridium sp. C8-1-8 TaxID=2698831 RepID=UPI00136E0D93|nr:hypothetical protein [Clostridium sp. C8-1-8]
MSRINAIQKAIQSLDGGEYQKLMDAYLCKKFNFSNIQPLGSHTGTNKVTKGIPDSYVKLENGKYILIMYGTVESTSYEKIEKDIKSCFNKDKLDLDKMKISEIICCYTSTNIHIEQQEMLENMIEYIKITLLGIGTVSNDLLIHYPTIASEFLNIPIDTQQIYDIKDFVRLYDKNGMNAPINMELLFRESEIDSLMSKLAKDSVVLVSGNSGVGKTRLVLEVCRFYQEKYGAKVLCIKNNGQMLYNDLKYYLSDPGDYLIFIDDANQTTQLEHVLDYVITPSSNVNIKVIMTVRDYAQSRVEGIVRDKIIPQIEKVHILSDDTITGILESNLGIKNETYLRQIKKIAKGNPRLAVLAGRIAIDKGYVSIYNSTDIFRFYYEGIMERIFDSRSKILVAFVIALLGPVAYKTNRIAISILSNYGIGENDFYLICHDLNENEIVDLFLDQAVKISDQSMANYLLYYVLIEKRYITITEIIKNGFLSFKNKILYALSTITNLFYSESALNYIRDQVNEVWSVIDNSEEQFEYIKCFHALNEEKSMAYIKKRIDDMETEDIDLQSFDFKRNMNNHSIKSEYLDILGKFKYSDNYNVILELIIYYFKKRPREVMDFYFLFTDYLGYDAHSYQIGYKNEMLNVEYLWKASKEGQDINITILMLHVIESYTKYEYHITESNGGKSVDFITLSLQMGDGLDKLRALIWGILGNLYQKGVFKDFIDRILLNFNPHQQYGNDSKSIFKADLEYIKDNIINFILIPSITQCKVLRHLEGLCKIFDLEEETLKKYNLNEDFKIYHALILDYEYGDDWQEKENEKKANIYRLINNYKQKDFINLFRVCKYILDCNEGDIDWHLQTGIETVFDLIKDDLNQYKIAVEAYLECNTPCYYRADEQISILLVNIGIEETERIIMDYEYNQKNMWIYDFLSCIPHESINKRYAQLMQKILNEQIEKGHPILPKFDVLIKYKKFIKDIVSEFSSKLLRKFSSEARIIGAFIGNAINDEKAEIICNIFKDNITILENLYIAALSSHVDLKGNLFIRLAEGNKGFLNKYIIKIINDNDRYQFYYAIDRLWQLDNYDEFIDFAYDVIVKYSSKRNSWYTGRYIEKIFINNDKTNDLVKERKLQWIKNYIDINCNETKKIVDIFKMIAECLKFYKKELIIYLLSKNSDIDMFKEITFFPSFMSWSGSEVPIIEEEINFLNELIDSINGLDYIEHRAYLKEKVMIKEKSKQAVLLQEYLEDSDLA